MAQDDVIDKKNPEALKKIIEKEVDFDEEEAYFELCEIIEMARQTGNYAKFQNDLNQWKKHYPIELFSDKYKSKIKYMLSEEFLDSILKNYLSFLKYSALDPNKQLDKFRRIFNKAEIHKDAKRLDSDLEAFYKEYPLQYLKEKFPHIVARLLSKSNREKILEKFDSKEAYEEFVSVIYDTEGFTSLSDLESVLKPLREKYPLNDFSDEYRSKLDVLLSESSLKNILEASNEMATLDTSDLDDGTVIALDSEKSLRPSGVINQKTAYFELLEIMKNPNDLNGIFNWTHKYMKYVNNFDDYHKGLIIAAVTPYYKIPKQHDYRIPIMDSKSYDYLSFTEYKSINDIKKQSVLQYMAILSTTGSLTNDDIDRLETIHRNSIKAQAVDLVSSSLDLFAKKTGNNTLKLTLSDSEYFGEKPNSSGSTDGGVAIPQFEEIKKRNNNSGSTDGGTTIAHIAEEELPPKPSDFAVTDVDKSSDSEETETSILIDYSETNIPGKPSIDIKVVESPNNKASTDIDTSNSSSDDTSFNSEESSDYKVIPFESEENSNDLERSINPNSNYIPLINPEHSLDEEENNGNNPYDTNINSSYEQDRTQDFSTFAKRIVDDDEREL